MGTFERIQLRNDRWSKNKGVVAISRNGNEQKINFGISLKICNIFS
jgi:hypothetical protein